MMKECMHNQQVAFEDGMVVCSVCRKRLVWVQAVQLKAIMTKLEGLIAEVDALRGVA